MRTVLKRATPVALCVCVVLLFGFGSGAFRGRAAADRSSSAGASPELLRPIGRAPAFSVAATRGVAELIGSGDHSVVAWNPRTGLWGGHTKPNWWQSALAVLTLIRYAERLHSTDPVYQRVLLRIYQRNIYKPHSAARREFANEFMDDTAWWGIAWLEASRYERYQRHDLFNAARFLSVAEWDARYINSQKRPCGGIEWAMRRPPDTVTSAEFIALTGSLATYRQSPGVFYDPAQASVWAAEAREALAWLRQTGLVNLQAGRVVDGLNARCRRTGGSMTYTQGEVAEALVQMGLALHDSWYFGRAEGFLRYTLSPVSRLTANGVLQEHCEAQRGGCSRLHYKLDIPAYKGLFIVAVVDFSRATRSRAFNRFLRAQAAAVVNDAIRVPRDAADACGAPQSCQFGLRWTPSSAARVSPRDVSLGSQESALDALTAALPKHR